MAETYNPGRERVQVTAAPNLRTQAARVDPTNALLEALGSNDTQNALAGFEAKQKDDTLREQQVKFDWYVEQFQKDHTGGAVSQAQIKQRFPETVPVIAARVAEAIGQREGKKQFEGALMEVAGNDSLRLDTAARGKFLADKRAEITANVGPGKEFYGAGMVGAIDKLTSQYEMNWASETAAYHQKVQAEQFSSDVVLTLSGPDPHAGLLALDGKYGKSSSLNNVERNKLVIATARDHALAGRNTAMLDNIPARFLNADAKADLAKTRNQIQDMKMGDIRDRVFLEGVKRDDDSRAGRTAIVQAASEGKPLDPAQFAKDPDLFAFANSAREMNRVPDALSASAVQAYETQIWTDATRGSSRSMKDYSDAILAHPGINAKDKGPLVARLEKLMEGTMVMQDALVKDVFRGRVDDSIRALEHSALAPVYVARGVNLREAINKVFETDIRSSWQAYFETNGNYPRGLEKQKLVDRALDAANAQVDRMMNPKGMKAGAAAPAATPATTTKAASPRKGWAPG